LVELHLAPQLCRVRGWLVAEAANGSEYWTRNPATASLNALHAAAAIANPFALKDQEQLRAIWSNLA